MERRAPVAVARLVALLVGVGLATVTVVATLGYAVFMVLWMHAPALQVVLVSTALAVPLLLLAGLAMWLGRGRTAFASEQGGSQFADLEATGELQSAT